MKPTDLKNLIKCVILECLSEGDGITLSDVPDLSPDELRIISTALNTFSTGGHPMPDKDTIPHFNVGYVVEILKKAEKKLNRPQYKNELVKIKSILSKLSYLKEMSTTGGVAGYNIPAAFAKKGSKPAKKAMDVTKKMGYTPTKKDWE